MELQLHMCVSNREYALQRHDFYVREVEARVLANFTDVEREAEAHAEAEYARLGRVLDPERWDISDVAEMANDRGQAFYGLLSDLSMQMRLGALAGLYHQWDKDLREFVDRELSHRFKRRLVEKVAWRSNANDMFELLSEFGWDCQAEPFFADLDACRLIVNVHKHGKGASLDQLAKKYPEFLARPLWPGGELPAWMPLDHQWLEVTADQFNRLAAAMRAFWEACPEYLVYAASAESKAGGGAAP